MLHPPIYPYGLLGLIRFAGIFATRINSMNLLMNFFSTTRTLFKYLLTLAALILPAHSLADDSIAVSLVADATGVPANPSPRAPVGAMLLAPTIQFKNAAGTPAYYQEAYEYHCHAARDGSANSQFALGWLYTNGRGVAKDDVLATYLYAMAATQGHARAQEQIAGLSAATAQPALPACLLPDPPPPPVVSASSSDADIQYGPVDFYPKDGPIFNLVSKLAPRYQIDADLAMAFIAVESGFNAKATSPRNAQGLMQLIPETAKRFRVKNAYNPEDNIKGGLAYLQWLMAFFEGNVELVAAAYNAGEKAVERYKGVPPYPETRNYVKKISSLYKRPTHPFRDDLVKASNLIRP